MKLARLRESAFTMSKSTSSKCMNTCYIDCTFLELPCPRERCHPDWVPMNCRIS